MTLAYVFWHWTEVPADTYERALTQFTEALRTASIPGLAASCTHRVHGMPWLPTDGPAYEDWHLLDDSSGLDRLNEAAVSGSCRAPHDDVARLASSGVGALYRLRLGDATIDGGTYRSWFARPPYTSYSDVDVAMAPDAHEVLGLWCRQMVLGPSPEFCAAAPVSPRVPPGISTLVCGPDNVA